MHSAVKSRLYYPALLSRRGELIAWGSAIVLAAAWLVLHLVGQRVNFSVPLLTSLTFLAALSITLGNWMDRKTVISTADSAISYQNGLRRIQLSWQEIREVRVIPSRWGKKVQVIGKRGYFAFHTLGEVKVGGELKGRVGFVDGDEILRQIILNSGLKIVEGPGEGNYYARE